MLIPPVACASPASIVVQQATPNPASTLNIDVRGVSLSAFCERLALRLGRPITVAPELRSRRILALSSNLPPAYVLSHLVSSLGFSLREKEGGYEIYRSEEQEKLESKEDRISRRRYEDAFEQGYQKLSLKLSEATTSPVIGLGTFLNGFSGDQRESMLRMAQQPMGILYAGGQKNLNQRILFARPFKELSTGDQATLKNLLEQGGYEFRGLGEPPKDTAGSRVGIVAAFGALRLGIIGPKSDEIWYEPTYEVTAPSLSAGQTADPSDYDPVVAQERENGQLVRGLTPTLERKKVRFAALRKVVHLPALLKSIEKQTGLAFFGPCYLNSAYPPWMLEGIKDGEDITLGDLLTKICRAYGQRMIVRDGVVSVFTLTPGLDRRVEPPPAVMALLAEKNTAKLPTLTRENFGALCALGPAQLLLLLRVQKSSPWVDALSNQLQNSYLAANFYAALSDAQRTQAEKPEGLDLTELERPLKKSALLLTEAGLPLPGKDEARPPLHFFAKFSQKTVEGAGEVLEKVVLTFVSRDGQVRQTQFTF